MLAYADPNIFSQPLQTMAPWLAMMLGAASTAVLMGWRWIVVAWRKTRTWLVRRPLAAATCVLPGSISRRDAMMLLWGSTLGMLTAGWLGFARSNGHRGAGHQPKHAPALGRAPSPGRKLLILGMDGLDPELLGALIGDGQLPAFAHLAREGRFTPLATLLPAASPVVWSSFSTGTDPGRHGIFDFIHRTPAGYGLDLSMTRRDASGGYVNSRQGATFWQSLSGRGVEARALFAPCSFPPEQVDGLVHAGMGVPDIKGHMGRYVLITNDPAWQDRSPSGHVIRLRKDRSPFSFEMPGPLIKGFTGLRELTTKIVLQRDDGTEALRLTANGGRTFTLAPRQWSDWVEVAFDKPFGAGTIHGICRFYLVSLQPHLTLYCTAVHYHPGHPAHPLSHPPAFSGELAARIGLYATLGLPVDTKAYEDDVLDAEGLIAMGDAIVDEQRRILAHTMNQWERGTLFAYFNTPDPIQHMFWEHGLKQRLAQEGAASIPAPIAGIYRKMDQVLGETLAKLENEPETQILVVSDHGFTDFRYAVEPNRVLAELGYLRLKSDAASGEPLFGGIDWSRTRAYAAGFSSVYLNLQGRESQGQVGAGASDRRRLLTELRRDLLAYTDSETGEQPFSRVEISETFFSGPAQEERPDLVLGCRSGYRVSWVTALGGVGERAIEPNRKKWRGDHIVDPEAVPGVLLARHADAALPTRIQDTAGYVLHHHGLSEPVLEEL